MWAVCTSVDRRSLIACVLSPVVISVGFDIKGEVNLAEIILLIFGMASVYFMMIVTQLKFSDSATRKAFSSYFETGNRIALRSAITAGIVSTVVALVSALVVLGLR